MKTPELVSYSIQAQINRRSPASKIVLTFPLNSTKSDGEGKALTATDYELFTQLLFSQIQ
jgi:hypothetical protein